MNNVTIAWLTSHCVTSHMLWCCRVNQHVAVCVYMQGVFVSRVAEDSLSYRAGLRVGDKLVSVMA